MSPDAMPWRSSSDAVVTARSNRTAISSRMTGRREASPQASARKAAPPGASIVYFHHPPMARSTRSASVAAACASARIAFVSSRLAASMQARISSSLFGK